MPRLAKVEAACHLLLALSSIRICLELNKTLVGKLVVWLAHVLLVLRTCSHLASGSTTALGRGFCAWVGAARLILSMVVLHGLGVTVRETLSAAASRQTEEVVQKVVQHCGNGISLLTSSWFTVADQGFASRVLPEWAILLLAEGNYAIVMRMHAVSLPGQSLLLQAIGLQIAMVLLPWLYRQRQAMRQQQQLQAVQSQSQHEQALVGSSSATAGGKRGNGHLLAGPSQNRTGRAGGALVQHSSKVAASYTAALGAALRPMCIKIGIPALEPEHLPPHAPQLLAAALAHASQRVGTGIIMLDMAVRRGCILIAFQTLQSSTTDAATEAGAADVLLQLSQRLVPGLLRSLGLAADPQSMAKLLGPKTCISLQRGSQLVQANYRPFLGEWAIAKEPGPCSAWKQQGGQVCLPSLGLARLCHYLEPELQRDRSNSSSTTRSGPAQPACNTAYRSSVVLEVPVTCHVWAAGALPCIVGGLLGLQDGGLLGLQDGKTGAALDRDDPSLLQLYALVDRDYIPAHVLSLTPSAGSKCVIVKVEVQLQPNSLVHHHQDGPLAALQPLCLQLWCGKLLLSSSHMLLSLPAAAGSSPTTPAATGTPFGWWGVSPLVALNAAVEIQAEMQCHMAQDEQDMQPAHDNLVTAATQELVRDVCYWLYGVRHLACTSHWCVCLAAEGSGRLGLPQAQLQLLGDSLTEYALARGWSSLHTMLQQQLQHIVIRAPQAGSSTCSPASKSVTKPAHSFSGLGLQVAETAAQARTAVWGLTCPHCEQRVMYGMHHSLAHASVCLSFLSAVISTTIVGKEAEACRYALCWLAVAWGVMHLAMGVTKLLTDVMPLISQSRPRHSHTVAMMQLLPVLTFILKAVMFAVTGSRWGHALQAVQRQHQFGTWIALHLVPVLADRLALHGVLSQRAITLLGLLETGLIIRANARWHTLGWSVLGAAGSALLAPFLVELRAHARLRVSDSDRARQQHPGKSALRVRKPHVCAEPYLPSCA